MVPAPSGRDRFAPYICNWRMFPDPKKDTARLSRKCSPSEAEAWYR